MNIQIFGTNKCFDTKKAERYFKERQIKFQFIDLNEKGLSKGELASVKHAVGLENMIKRDSKAYKSLHLDKISSQSLREELLFNHPGLYQTPIVRNGRAATVGYAVETWETWKNESVSP